MEIDPATLIPIAFFPLYLVWKLYVRTTFYMSGIYQVWFGVVHCCFLNENAQFGSKTVCIWSTVWNGKTSNSMYNNIYYLLLETYPKLSIATITTTSLHNSNHGCQCGGFFWWYTAGLNLFWKKWHLLFGKLHSLLQRPLK